MLIATNEHTAIIHNSKYSCAYTHRDGEGEGEEREREREREREWSYKIFTFPLAVSMCVYTFLLNELCFHSVFVSQLVFPFYI